MSTHVFVNRNLPRLIAISLGTMCIGQAIPAQATPQLLYRSVQESGNLDTCLNRAQAAMTDAGLMQQPPTPNSINGRNLQLAATIYCQPLDTQSFQAMVIVAGEEDANLAEINSILSSLSSVLANTNPDSLPDSDLNATMNDAEFGQFMAALEDSWPDYLDFLAQPVSSNYFTAAQASQIVGHMSFSEDEIQAAAILYPRVVDRNNWFVVEQALTFRHDLQELREQIDLLYGQ